MDRKRTLFSFGVTATSSSKRSNVASESALESSEAQPDIIEVPPSVPNVLSESKIRDRQRDFPWALYVGPSHFSGRRPVHLWRCSYCEKNGGSRTEFKFKDNHEFTRHAGQEKHKCAEESIVLRSKMQESREQHALQVVESIQSETGRLLVVVAFMVTCGISLKLYPQVCVPADLFLS